MSAAEDAAAVGPEIDRSGDTTARVAEVRAFLRANGEVTNFRETLSKIAYQAYLVFVIGGLWGIAVFRALRDPSAVRASLSTGAVDAIPVALITLAFLGSLAGVRLGTWAGPVLVSRSEAAWLLPAPLDRRRLLRPNLVWGLVGFGVVGAFVGLIGGVVVALETPAGVAGPVFGSLLGWGALGVLAGVASLAVESFRTAARLVLRGTAVLLLLGAGVFVLAQRLPAVAAWIPPWGWAAAPTIAGIGVDVPLAWVPTVLLVVLAVVAVRWAAGHLDRLPDEELVRRAGVSTGIKASAAVFDARAIAQARRSGQQWLIGHRRVHLPRPKHRWSLIVWRDAVSLLRRRGLPERVAVAVGVATVLLVWSAQHVGGGVLAVVVLSATAGQLLEPMRIELEEPVAGDLTPFAPHDLVPEHLIVPVAALSVAGFVALVVLAGTGIMPWAHLGVAMAGVLVGATLLTSIAGLASTRGAAPLHWLTQGEYGAMMLVGWVLAGPLLALVLVAPMVLIGVNALGQGAAPFDALFPLVVFGILFSAILVAVARYRAKKRVEG